MTRTVEDLRDRVAPRAGIGGYGHDFGPYDRHTSRSKKKLLDVLAGRHSLSYDEIQRILVQTLTGR